MDIKIEYNKALQEIQKKEFLKAYEILNTLLEVEPFHKEIVYSFAQVALRVKKYQEAILKLSVYHQKVPTDSKANVFLAILYKHTQSFQKAIPLFLNTIQEENAASLWIHLSECYYHLGQAKKTEESLKNALLLAPQNIGVLNRLAFLYHQTGKLKLAYQFYSKIENVPELQVQTTFTLALLSQELNMPHKAIAYYQKHLSLAPNNADAHYALGVAYANIQDYEKAILSFENALKYNENHLQSKMEIASARMAICDWKHYDADKSTFETTLETLISEGNISLSRALIDMNYFDLSPALHLKTAKKCAFQIEQSLGNSLPQNFPNRHSNQKIRIGYLSPDFREHAVGRLVYDMFRHHDKQQFEVYVYALVVPQNEDEITKEIKKGSDFFIDCQGKPFTEVAHKIKADQIDILIDMVGYTTFGDPKIAALKPAPVQIHYIGNPDTMGANFLPNILTDTYLLPEKSLEFYTENPVYLEHAWVASPLPKNLPKLSRQDYNLPENAFVFCSFNLPKKLNPSTFNFWMKILQEVNDSVLWLYAPLKSQQENLLESARKVGVEAERIFFAESVSYPEYLSRFRLADVFLDNFQYGAGSTAANSLMMGLPLLTLTGKNMVARLGTAVNAAAGMKDWNCTTENEYYEKAVYWANHIEELKEMKSNLPERVLKSELCNVEGFVRNMELALKQLIEK